MKISYYIFIQGFFFASHSVFAGHRFLRFYLFIFRERRGEGEREGEKHQCVVASHMSVPSPPALGTWSGCKPGMWPDWESNQRPFDLQASAQSTEPHQPGQGISNYSLHTVCLLKFFLFIHFERKRSGEERERNVDVREKHWSVAPCTRPNWGPNLPPRHVPWPGIWPTTFCCVGRCPTNWAPLVRALPFTLKTLGKKRGSCLRERLKESSPITSPTCMSRGPHRHTCKQCPASQHRQVGCHSLLERGHFQVIDDARRWLSRKWQWRIFHINVTQD